jgi:hypothetical protein
LSKEKGGFRFASKLLLTLGIFIDILVLLGTLLPFGFFGLLLQAAVSQ